MVDRPISSRRPSTLFPRPEWKLLPDLDGVRPYANVSNRMEVMDQRGRIYHVALAVPTGFFTLARDVLDIAITESVDLGIAAEGRYFVFTAVIDTNRLFDLWYYTPATLPDWITDTAYRLGHKDAVYKR